jgi:hypothetical protein
VIGWPSMAGGGRGAGGNRVPEGGRQRAIAFEVRFGFASDSTVSRSFTCPRFAIILDGDAGQQRHSQTFPNIPNRHCVEHVSGVFQAPVSSVRRVAYQSRGRGCRCPGYQSRLLMHAQSGLFCQRHHISRKDSEWTPQKTSVNLKGEAQPASPCKVGVVSTQNSK